MNGKKRGRRRLGEKGDTGLTETYVRRTKEGARQKENRWRKREEERCGCEREERQRKEEEEDT